MIGNGNFRPESGLPVLQGPVNDVAALSRLLRLPGPGQFDVREFVNRPHYEILPELETALGNAVGGDLVLIYYSGHGKLDRDGALCLTTEDTLEAALTTTSIQARRLTALVERSDCDQVVLLLDCCYSGAVEDGYRGGDATSELHVVENARGFYILTASSNIQSARESDTYNGRKMGRFTAALIAGIESRLVDQKASGPILLSDLRRYVEQRLSGQTPQFFARRASGDPVICPLYVIAPPNEKAGSAPRIRLSKPRSDRTFNLKDAKFRLRLSMKLIMVLAPVCLGVVEIFNLNVIEPRNSSTLLPSEDRDLTPESPDVSVGAQPFATRPPGPSTQKVADFSSIEQQLRNLFKKCWTGDVIGDKTLENISLRFVLNYDETGKVRDVTVADGDRIRLDDPLVKSFADRAIRAILDPNCADLSRILPGSSRGRRGRTSFTYTLAN